MSTPYEERSVVRPYALTKGRTEARRDYPIEALVVDKPGATGGALSPEMHAIRGLCRSTQSIAEIAAHLKLPLGVVRVLVGDLEDHGLVSVHSQEQTDSPDIDLLERVLGGLRRL